MSNFSLFFDCPNCGATKSTFDVLASNVINQTPPFIKWQFYGVCRGCLKGVTINGAPNVENSLKVRELVNPKQTIIIPGLQIPKLDLLPKGSSLNHYFTSFYVSNYSLGKIDSPEHLPQEIKIIFEEAATCLATKCFNASAAMFRLCLDMTTKDILNKNKHLNPTQDNNKTIHKRLNWIFENHLLSANLEDLSRCIKDDGNDGAHDGTIGQIEADDLFDFTSVLLEQVYTQPEKVRIARERRQERHS